MIVLTFMIGLLVEGYTRGVLGENSADAPKAAGTTLTEEEIASTGADMRGLSGDRPTRAGP